VPRARPCGSEEGRLALSAWLRDNPELRPKFAALTVGRGAGGGGGAPRLRALAPPVDHRRVPATVCAVEAALCRAATAQAGRCYADNSAGLTSGERLDVGRAAQDSTNKFALNHEQVWHGLSGNAESLVRSTHRASWPAAFVSPSGISCVVKNKNKNTHKKLE
jgi:hypothetical protein